MLHILYSPQFVRSPRDTPSYTPTSQSFFRQNDFISHMEPSPKLSTIVEEAHDNGRGYEDNLPEPYSHFLDRISNKEGYRAGVYWTSGDHYCGEWHENLRHGRGMHTYKSGNRYEGEWKFGKKNGHGTFWIKCGKYYIRKYRGSWKDNQYGGSGCYYGFGGERYNGQWEKGKRHGLGTQTYRDWNANGEVYHEYHGEWVNGKREGLGQLTLANGNVYQGEWKNDWKEGIGFYYYKDRQSKYEGLWRDDIAVSGVYSRNTMSGQLELPFVMLPDARASNQKFLTLAAFRPLPPRYDRTERRTDPQVCTKKFYNVLHGSPLLDTGRPL